MVRANQGLRVFLVAGLLVAGLFSAGCRPHRRHHSYDNDYHGGGGSSRYYDPYEPNDTEFLAHNLGGPKRLYTINATIGEDGDEDWFTFWQDDGYDIDIILSSLPDDYELQLYDDDGDLIASSTHSGTANESVFAVAQYSGHYYIRVQGFGTAHDADDPYLLEVNLE